MSEVQFKVPSISCSHCVRTIQGALGKANGVQQVAVDIDSKQVSIVYDATAIDEDGMKAILAEADYPVAEVGGELSNEVALSAAGASCGCCKI